MDEIIETGSVTGIASEGQGIIRQNGLVTFIPYTVTGDEIEYRTIQRKKNFANGKLVKVTKPSQDRVTPLCKYYQICGGCQLQHLNYASQIEYKRQWIEDSLRKIGKLNVTVPAISPANLQWAYRRRVHLILRRHQDHYQAGYISTDNKSLVAVDSCPIFIKDQDPILVTIQAISKEFQCADFFDGKVTVLKAEPGYIAHFHFRNMPENAFAVLSQSLKDYPLISGILASSQKKTFQLGKVDTAVEIDGLTFDFSPKTFIQSHPEQSLNIYKTLVNIAKEANSKNILDLYCGIGISSLLFAKLGCKVKGVELNPQSIALAKSNANSNQLQSAKFVIADVEKVLKQMLSNDQPDFILVNPPREGLSPIVTQGLAVSSAKTVVYVSCMPSTLARDLKILCEKGYEVASVQAFDMFPQTIHVETVVVLKQKTN